MANLLLDGMHNAPAVSQCRGSDDGAHFHLVFAEQVITAQTTLQLSGYKPGMNVESLSKADDALFSKKWCDTCDEAIHFLFGLAKLGACRIGDDFFLADLIRSGAFEVLIQTDRKSVVWGKSVSVRVDLGGRRILKKQKKQKK